MHKRHSMRQDQIYVPPAHVRHDVWIRLYYAKNHESCKNREQRNDQKRSGSERRHLIAEKELLYAPVRVCAGVPGNFLNLIPPISRKVCKKSYPVYLCSCSSLNRVFPSLIRSMTSSG